MGPRVATEVAPTTTFEFVGHSKSELQARIAARHDPARPDPWLML